MGRKTDPNRPTVDDNPHLPRPYESWMNEGMAIACLDLAMRSVCIDTSMRLKRWFTRDDLLQETYVAMWRAAPLYNPERGELSTLLVRATRNHLIRIALMGSFVAVPYYITRLDQNDPRKEAAYITNKIKSESVTNPDGEKWRLEFATAGISSEHETNQEQVEVVLEAMEQLDPEDRKIILDYYLGEKLLKEIGADLGVCKERIRQRRNTALRKLRSLLGVE